MAQSTSPEDQTIQGIISKRLFGMGTLYFLLTTIYSLIFYREKFMLDGTSIVFDIVNEGWFPETNQRMIMCLQEMIPLVMSWLHVKLKYILMGYIFNVYLLYYIGFFLIAVKLKDNALAVAYLLVNYLGNPYNYFLFVEELLPGASAALLLVSIISNPGRLSPKWCYTLIIATAFFMVSSHPMAAICFALAATARYFLGHANWQLRTTPVAFAFTCVAVFMAVKYATLNPYDRSMLVSTKPILQNLQQLASFKYLREALYYLFTTRTTFSTAFIVCVIYLIVTKKYKLFVGFISLLAALLFILNMKIDFSNLNIWDVPFHGFDRWSLPIRFWVFVTACFCLTPLIKNELYLKVVSIALLILFAKNALTIFEITESAVATTRQADEIIRIARELGIKKGLVMKEELRAPGWVHFGVYHDILLYSSLDGPENSVQVVYADSSLLLKLAALPEDKVWLMDSIRVLRLDQLDSNYFRVDRTAYRQINLSASIQ